MTPAVALNQAAEAIEALAAVDPTQADVEDLGAEIIRLQSLVDAAEGVAAGWTKCFADAGGPELAGAPTLTAWLRRELRLTPHDARRRMKAAVALDAFPATRAEFFAGNIHHKHLDAIAQGVHQLGPKVWTQFEEIVLDVARVCDADAVRTTIAKIRDTLDPDAAEEAYVRALERRDVTVTAVGDGFALGGFLPADTGAMFQQLLYTHAKPTSKDDDRPAGHRRVDGLHELCKGWLDHGLPSDRGMRPHLFVTVTADRLEAVTRGLDTTGTPPATLSGSGGISDSLLSKLACDCAVTPVIVDGLGPSASVLDVGRTSRLATLKQRQAIHVQQGGTCATPGCDGTHLEIHHRIPWSLGGRTNLGELGGYCTRCHHLIHQGLLLVSRDADGGWQHRSRAGRRLIDRRRRRRYAANRFTEHVLAGGVAYAREQRKRWHRGDPVVPPPPVPSLPPPRRNC